MNFSELNLHPTVAGALAKRGYDTATPVQSAVLHPDAAGRDLLVSSQTGSGKTIAFGAALAASLLAPEAARTGQRTNPLALVIVPTRELAVQVREELGWLLRDTKLRLASFTGGTPVSGDLRTLQKGLDIAIGTPGRLVDLLKRQRLELGDIRAVVLDEADEMLDLGFREDLQTLLQEAPESRRTLLLSATLPPEIQALARRFQRDALRIDPRKTGDQAARGAHGDITYVAHLIAGADRLAVVVNILRAAGDGRAIVFCTTREGVSRLHAALLQRGFSATAISGDRAQAERDRALEQVRKGDVRVLVATNVAARGLHLPDVDLIVHADLPLNAESLTHRSGRTGRAGRKGTAVVIASMMERRKAERLLMSANVPVVWTAPPSAESITAAARERLAEELLQDVSADSTVGAGEDPFAEEMINRLEQTLPARELARRLLLREFTRLPIGERVQNVAVPGPERRDRFAPARGGGGDDRAGGRGGDGHRPGRGDFARDGVMFRVNLGVKDNADPRWLLPLICRRGGVESRNVGAIHIGPSETMFEISGDAAADFALSSAERDPRAPHVTFEPARSGGGLGNERDHGDRGRDPRRPAPAMNAHPRSTMPSQPSYAAKAEHKTEVPRAAPVRMDEAAPAAAAGEPPKKRAVVAPAAPAEKHATARSPKREPVQAVAPTASSAPPSSAAKAPPPPRTPAPAAPRAPAPAATRTPAPAPVATRVPASTGTPAVQPSSIFQTRTPEPRPQGESAGQSDAPGPVIERKRAPRVGNAGHHAPAAPRAEVQLQRPDDTRPPHPRTDGTNPVKRHFGGPRASEASPSARPTHHARVSPSDRLHRPAPGGDTGRPAYAGRPAHTDRPTRDAGPAHGGRPTRTDGAPSFGSRPERTGRPEHAGRPAAGPDRPPFWKDGARKRGATTTHHGSGADAAKGKAPRR